MSFRDLTWYRNALRAGNKALVLSNKTADSIIIIRDMKTNMFGIGIGSGEPQWCKDSDTHDFIATINPTRH
jgi:hypothetical protein